KLDRFSRNLLDLLQTIHFLSGHDCSYVSASESFDTSTAVGRMTLQLLGTFAEFERERTSERVKDNMLSLAKNTDKALTKPCYGYNIEDGRYVIDEAEAENVQFMFDLAEQGHGHRMIAKFLNEKGVFTKKGKLWDQINVKRLMYT
ncbi:recombinase family protein, partial [Paenarthrobacter sp. YAF11_1]|uniref:recombinase family protein n=1 Tax=Paenarthrobacter sp. YAF11_1 TaxID=3233074 RepID=UPI003F9B9D45